MVELEEPVQLPRGQSVEPFLALPGEFHLASVFLPSVLQVPLPQFPGVCCLSGGHGNRGRREYPQTGMEIIRQDSTVRLGHLALDGPMQNHSMVVMMGLGQDVPEPRPKLHIPRVTKQLQDL